MTEDKESSVAIRDIVLGTTMYDADHHSFLEGLAKKTIHNLIKFQAIVTSNEIGISLTTEDSSYDLSAFYTQLTNHGYIIK